MLHSSEQIHGCFKNQFPHNTQMRATADDQRDHSPASASKQKPQISFHEMGDPHTAQDGTTLNSKVQQFCNELFTISLQGVSGRDGETAREVLQQG